MALILNALVEILRKPTIVGVVSELMLFCGPLWVAVFVGLLVGWAWRPKWATDLVGREKGKSAAATAAGPRLSLSFSVVPSYGGPSLMLGFPSLDSLKAQLPSCITSFISDESSEKVKDAVAISSPEVGGERLAVTTEDLGYLCRLVEVTDGGREWQHMMDRSLPNMSYQAWRRDAEMGPPQYRSRTVFEDATPETVRDFFWDDEFRMKARWDDMLIRHETLQECPTTGTMLVHWVRKFPFFCSNREYTIGRRIWESGREYYCVTKGVPCSSVPRRNKPRRVDLYYSSWCIRAVESRRGDGQVTACEVLLFHYEDMGIPWEIAKLGVRQGMWSCVKKIEPGLRAYQMMARKAGEPLSRCALMAQINTKVSANYLRSLETSNDYSSEIEQVQKNKPLGRNIPKFLVVGGAVVLACTLDRGLLTKALIFGVARRFAKPGR